MDTIDKEIIRNTQEGLPITEEPYAEVASKIGVSEEELLRRLRRMISEGVVRRMGASIAHRRAGIAFNAMCAWRVPPERVDEVGEALARLDEVTHCYERDTLPDWPYNVYVMVHGRSKAECEDTIRKMNEAAGLDGCKVLYGVREFKKKWTRL